MWKACLVDYNSHTLVLDAIHLSMVFFRMLNHTTHTKTLHMLDAKKKVNHMKHATHHIIAKSKKNINIPALLP